MSETELEEIKLATEDFNKALNRLMNAKGFTDPNMVLIDYIIITVQSGFADDGAGISAYGYLLYDDEMAWHKILGMLSVTEKRITKDYLSSDSDYA